MTTDIIELSKQAAEVLGEPANAFLTRFDECTYSYHEQEFWLAEDSGRCAEIANSKKLDTINFEDAVVVEYDDEILTVHRHAVYLSDHQGDRNAAWRIAVLRAVIEQGKQ